jgi:hypothetical protein
MPPSTFAQRAYGFYRRLTPPRVPKAVTVMNPYAEPRVQRYLRTFLDAYFDDNDQRVLAVGINPGRFGAGVTGVTFTDPVALADFAGIPNDLPRRRELSSVFVYDFIDAWGGVPNFYRHFFLSAVSPLGFTAGGTNLNYYDTPALQRAVTPFIAAGLKEQVSLGCTRKRVIVLGMGQNLKFLQKLNADLGLFEELVPLEHPRWIMQYRRRRVDEFLRKYVETFAAALRP